MRLLQVWKGWARALKREIHALYLACRDPRTPWHAKFVATLVAAYALSPIDLIPDPIPIIGYLDDLLLLPLGIWFAIRLIPADVMEGCRRSAEAESAFGKPNWLAATIIVVIWLLVATSLVYAFLIFFMQ